MTTGLQWIIIVTHRPLPDGWLADHPDAPFHTADSVEAGIALAKELAGDGLVCVTAGDVGGQALSAGLVDEVAMDVVPVVLGEGVRFFGSHAGRCSSTIRTMWCRATVCHTCTTRSGVRQDETAGEHRGSV